MTAAVEAFRPAPRPLRERIRVAIDHWLDRDPAALCAESATARTPFRTRDGRRSLEVGVSALVDH
ncbi:hypothetical protein [Rhodococcus opacus]|uniref:hypothetical protein n=1 Tax=Rhodococcus opacus TaxID=37919 RepID=UPI001C46B448|nr:hypothetical protein [Rhodococcus opacus]MBV6761279.1 hypothetical protein [Rhodococcus opacus]